MLGFTKSLGWKKSSAIVVTLAIAAVAVPHSIAAQQKRQSAIQPTTPPNPFNSPSQLGITTPPNSFNSPSQLDTTPGVAPRTSPDSRTSPRSRSTKRERRIPIPDVPMPGEYRPNLDPGPEKTRRLSDIPSSTTQAISGIAGKVTLIPICSFTAPARECQSRPYQGPLKLVTLSDGLVTRFNANQDGEFQLKLNPGLYRVESDDPTSPLGAGQVVTVVNGVLRQMEFQVQAQLPQSNRQSSSQFNSQSNPQSNTQFNPESNSRPNSQSGSRFNSQSN